MPSCSSRHTPKSCAYPSDRLTRGRFYRSTPPIRLRPHRASRGRRSPASGKRPRASRERPTSVAGQALLRSSDTHARFSLAHTFPTSSAPTTPALGKHDIQRHFAVERTTSCMPAYRGTVRANSSCGGHAATGSRADSCAFPAIVPACSADGMAAKVSRVVARCHPLRRQPRAGPPKPGSLWKEHGCPCLRESVPHLHAPWCRAN